MDYSDNSQPAPRGVEPALRATNQPNDLNLTRLESKVDALYESLFGPPLGGNSGGAYPSQAFGEEDRSRLVQYAEIVARRKWTVVCCVIVGVAGGAVFGIAQAPIYQAHATIDIIGLNANFMDMGSLDPSGQADSYSSEVYIQTQTDILKSRSIVKEAAARIRANAVSYRAHHPGPIAARIKSWRKSSEDENISLDRLASNASNDLTVQHRRGTRLIDVGFKAKNPQLAADFVNTLTSVFIDHSLQLRSGSSRRTQAWLSQELENLQKKLEQAGNNLQEYARASNLMITESKGSVSEEQLRQIQEELSRARADRIAKQSRAELAEAQTAHIGTFEAVPGIFDNGPLREYHVKLTELRRELADLNTAYVPTHYKVKRAQAQVAELQATYDRERSAVIERTQNDFHAAARREALLASAYSGQTKAVSEDAAKTVHYNLLKREVETYRHLYDQAMQKTREAGIASTVQASNARVVDAAEPPPKPSNVNLPFTSALGLIAGLFIGGTAAMVRERTDRSLRMPGDAAACLNVQELGVIPSATQDVDRYFLAGPPGANASILDRIHTEQKGLTLAGGGESSALLAESFRATLASILLSSPGTSIPQAIVVTSPGPGEGKSTVASNLAIALAQANHPVLLIDADLRRPRVHEIFDVPNTDGWGYVISRKNRMTDDEFDYVIKKTPIEGLCILPSGTEAITGSSLLDSVRLFELLRYSRSRFQTILIDTPPLLRMSDTRVLGRRADAVVLVCRSGRTTREAARAAKQRLADDGTPILGVVLNDWNPKNAASAYYGEAYRCSQT